MGYRSIVARSRGVCFAVVAERPNAKFVLPMRVVAMRRRRSPKVTLLNFEDDWGVC